MSEPAAAAGRPGAWSQGPWSELFGASRPKLRRAALARIRAAAEAASGGCAGSRAGSGPRPEIRRPPRATSRPHRPRPRRRPSACRLALSEEIAIAPSIPDIHGAGGCGGEDLVRLEAVVLPDKHLVAVKPAAILRCAMASAIADWIRTDMAPLAASLGSVISDLDNFDSFECRGRNRVAGARLSEHGRANALDVRAVRLANGQSISLTDRTVSRELARERAAFGVRAVFDGAGTGLGLVPRGPHPSRSDGAAQQLQNLPVERVGPVAADRAAAAGRAAG